MSHQIIDTGNYKYILANHHRSRQNHNKSRWTINQNEEFSCFERMMNNSWVNNNVKGWSLHRVNGQNLVLGVSTRDEEVKIAKFVDSANITEWHGYPVDYRLSIHDKPDIKIIRDWFDKGYITKSQMRKISQGQGCDI
ncbi:hypothetical protein U1P98_06555 [Lysinibacillus irui]|uniref:Homing endonuclease LAGLIDADG domain-containing protein n=1 Tax=Lysinibacillus irui TaxID=2998077 RepID=A0ABU5NIU4_9BACI|nr:hypothetical protein [Lysinibacillus irui]MEA0553574.1 hypothetical protein [Lysinibacillus irui]MEA0975958.1 hypothetical protein [Lysinibacillus irui]MEA1042112.1 hypothetical protein [Lysinibacillus irui]